MDIKDFKVGQKVWVKKDGDRSHIPATIHEAVVETVGKKYITVSGFSCKFGEGHHNRFREVTEYAKLKAIYFSEQDIIDEIEIESLQKLYRSGLPSNLSLDQLKRIKAIIEENK